MKKVWDELYGGDPSFFGEEPSRFALLCYQRMKRHNIKELLELGCGQGRDCIFLASGGINVKTFDYSEVAVNAVVKHANVLALPISVVVHNAKSGLHYRDQEFEAVYSHMFFSMHFTHEELTFLFSEVKRVLKVGGLHFFSVRSDKDKLYGKGRQVADGVYDVNGFEIRFFSKKDIMGLMRGFNIDEIMEDIEEPASLYLVFSRKT